MNPNQLINNIAQKMPVQQTSAPYMGPASGGSVPPVAKGLLQGGAMGAVGNTLGKIKNAIVNKMSPNVAQAQTTPNWIPTGVSRATYSKTPTQTKYDFQNPQQYYMVLNRQDKIPQSAYQGTPNGYEPDSYAAASYEAQKVGRRPAGGAPDTDQELAPWMQSNADRVVVPNPFANGAFDNLTPEQQYAAQQMMTDWNPNQPSNGAAHQTQFTDRGGLGFSAKAKQSGQDYYRQNFGGYSDATGFHNL